jgi:hypothetical protein
MRKLIALTCCIAVGMAFAGCGSSEATATKDEEEHFRNPSKTPPPEAGGPPSAPSGATYDPAKMGPPPEALKGPVPGQNSGK